MDDPTIPSPWLAKAMTLLWLIAPALAGALTAVAIAPRMSGRGWFISVFIGFFSAVFIAPAINDLLRLWWGDMPVTFDRAIIFAVGLTALGGLPFFVKWTYAIWGDPLGMLSRVRGVSQKTESDL